MSKAICRILTVVLAGALLAGCTPTNGSGSSRHFNSQNPAEAPLRITAVLPHDDLAYWTDVANGIRSAGEDLGVDIKVSLPQLNYSVPQMTELIRAATAARVDGIIVQGIRDEEYIDALKKAQQAGIQVVLVDTDLDEFPDHLYVGTDNYASGLKMGEAAIAGSGGSARIAVISGAAEYPNLEQRIQGIRDAIAGRKDIQLLEVHYNNYDSITTMEKYNEIRASENKIDTLLCVEGTSGMVFSSKLAARDPAFKQIIVFDLSAESDQGLRQGIVDMVIMQENSRMGYLCVEEIQRFAATGAYSASTIYTQAVTVTAENLEEGAYGRE